MHNVKSRIAYLSNLEKSFKQMHQFLLANNGPKENLKLIKKNVLMANYRQRVINNKSIYAALLLLIHGLNTYHKKRAWLMELKIGLNGV